MMMLPFTDVDGTEVLFTGAIVKWTISFMVAPFGIVW